MGNGSGFVGLVCLSRQWRLERPKWQEEIRMAGKPKPERTSAPSAWVQRIGTEVSEAGIAARRTLERLRGRKKSAMAETPGSESASAADEAQGSPTDLADADITVRRAWKHARWAVVIAVIAAQAAIALISWRIKVRRARRAGQPDPTL